MPRFAPGTDSAAATYVEHFLVGILRRAAFPRNIVTRWCGSRAIHKDASIAQLVEHRSRKAGVIGSSPIAGSMIFRRLLARRRFWYEPLSWIRTDEVAELGKAHERLCQRSARGGKRRSDPARHRTAQCAEGCIRGFTAGPFAKALRAFLSAMNPQMRYRAVSPRAGALRAKTHAPYPRFLHGFICGFIAGFTDGPFARRGRPGRTRSRRGRRHADKRAGRARGYTRRPGEGPASHLRESSERVSWGRVCSNPFLGSRAPDSRGGRLRPQAAPGQRRCALPAFEPDAPLFAFFTFGPIHPTVRPARRVRVAPSAPCTRLSLRPIPSSRMNRSKTEPILSDSF